MTLALRVEYLTGRCTATNYNDRYSAEWPPHPARVFSALVAAWADEEPPDQEERAALDWLAALPPPSVSASDASRRVVVPYFVPVNDVSVLRDFERQRENLDVSQSQVQRAETELREAVLAADEKAHKVAERQLVKLKKVLEKQRSDLAARLGHDQEPDLAPKAAAMDRARRVLPASRTRQPRTFPSVTPHSPVVYLIWDVAVPEGRWKVLDVLARRMVRLGHSSSLVSCRLVREAPPGTLVPKDDGPTMLRVPGAGQVTQLIGAHEVHQEIEPRVLPCRFQRYGPPEVGDSMSIPRSVFTDEWIVLRQVGGPRLSLTLCAEVTQGVRAALMSHSEDPPPELLSGHKKTGEPSETPHVAVLALPFVGNPHATGVILGVALVTPRCAAEEDRKALLRALGRWEESSRLRLGDDEVEAPPIEVRLGSRGVIELERVVWGSPPLANLRPATWCRMARTWISATPVALDRNPGNLRARDPEAARSAYEMAAGIIATGCERIGLPAPSRVEVIPSVPMTGVPKARAFPPFPADKKRPQRMKVHALLQFDAPVQGPVILGAGRYLGLGLFRPVDVGEAAL